MGDLPARISDDLHPANAPLPMKFILLPLFLMLALTPSLPAQDADEEKREARGRLAWFVATSIPDNLENPVQVMAGKDLTPVTLSKRSASGPVKIPQDGLIRLVRPVPDPNDPAKTTYQTLAQARVAETTGKALIILIPVTKPNSSLVYLAQVKDLASFTGGDYLYMNLTKVNIAVQLGDRKLALKPGDAKVYDAPRLDKAVNTPVSYHYFHPGRNQWKLLSASTVVLRPTRREICVFSWDPRYERVDYHGITFPVSR